MEYFIKYIFLVLVTLGLVNGEATIDVINDNITTDSITDNYYYLSMNENNHDYIADENLNIPFLNILNVPADSEPTITPLGQMFRYNFVKLSDTSWQFSSAQVFDYETMKKNNAYYSFMFGIAGESSLIIRLTIINIDDEPPTFTPPTCEVDEYTLYTKDNSTCYGVVEDPDGWLGYMSFEFNQPEFELHYREFPDNETYSANVYLTVLKMLDYQLQPFYTFNIDLKDGAGHPNTLGIVRAVIKVNDLRNNPPTWTKYLPYESFEEKQAMSFNVQARDGDKGINADVFYTVAEDEYNFITIDNTTGDIEVKPIDRDAYDLTIYSFKLMAYVEPIDPWNVTMDVNFLVIDIDDNPPVITTVTINDTNITDFEDVNTEKRIFLTFIENYDGNLNTSIIIKDIDQALNSEFSVILESPDYPEYAEAFMISPSTGLRSGTFQMAVKSKTNLDFENADWNHFKYYVLAEGTVNSSHFDRLEVSIQLIDYNDEWPIFENSSYEFFINETATKGELIGTVTATDLDAEDQGKLMYELITTQNTVDVGLMTGELTVAVDNAFDYDKINPIFLQVKVNDTVDHTSTVPVTINLLDVNNKAPTIEVSEVVNVDENQVEGQKLNVTITAADVDTTASLIAEIVWSESIATKNSRKLDLTNETIAQLVEFLDVDYSPKDSRNITIDLITKGNISDITTPDYELFDSLYLCLRVTDLHTDPDFMQNNSTVVTVLITINDLNDNIPYFPENNDVIKVNRTVTENARQDTAVGVITAVDLDQIDQGKIVYSCIPDIKTYDWLDIDSKTGALTVKSNSLVNADIPLWYINYTCTAVDSDPTHISEPLNLAVYIIDTNNKVPTTTLRSTVSVQEKTSEGEIVQAIVTQDDDRDPPFHTAFCSLSEPEGLCYGKFRIFNNVIEVKVKNGTKDLDRDYGDKSYSCSGTCRDNIHNELGDTTQNELPIVFTIELIDINDHAPELTEDTFYVYENCKKNEDIQKIVAIDPDEGRNGTIIFYYWTATKDSGEDATELFNFERQDDYLIDDIQKQYHLIAAEDLKGHYGNYTIEIHMKDNGTDPQKNKQSIKLEIKKYNFESPRFVFPTADALFTLNSEQTPNKRLIQFLQDEDLPDFSLADNSAKDTCDKWKLSMSVTDQELKSSLQQDKKFFTIKPLENCKFQLQVDDSFIDNQNSYVVTLTAEIEPEHDFIDGEVSYASNISINVDFRNKSQEPIFMNRTWSISFFEEDASQTNDSIQANYVPEQPDNLIYYYLNFYDDYTEDFFAINQNTGVLSLKKKLDYEVEKEFIFIVIASKSKDRESDDPGSRMNVTIEVIDINDNPPVFDNKLYYGAIMSPFANSIVVTANATDADERDQGKLTYHMVGDFAKFGEGLDNINNPPFEINELTGQIELKFTVDSSMSGYIYFTILVKDVQDPWGHGPFNDTAAVYIFIVTTDNIVTFLFQNSRSEVILQEKRMLEIVGENINNYTVGRQDIKGANNDNYSTNANLFFMDDKSSFSSEDILYYTAEKLSLIKGSDVLKIVTSYQVYTKLKQQLRNETGLILESFPSNSPQENLEPVLRAWLIGVSVVLGSLCLVLLIIFILKIRQLNRTISNLVTKKYGSQESGLNRIGVSLPTANKHAIEGSNPVYSIDREEKEREMYNYDDQKSIISGDSDLIGVEENPEFDYDFNESKNKDITTYL